MDPCPNEQVLADLLGGRLDDDVRTSVDAHVERCTACLELLATVAAADKSDRDGDEDDEPASDGLEATLPGGEAAHGRVEVGLELGAFVLLDRIGEGAMGVVYAAYDRSLDRKVAIKLVRSERLASDRARQRAMQEARAMARVAHPNVVSIHEVGEHRDSVYVVMEFIAGLTLRRWLSAEERDWRVILTTFLQAGRGLAAAHRAGVIHRDFKPDNVLVGDDGRTRVVDFGLARAGSTTARETSTRPELLSASPAVSLTQTGATIGTPAYMAPEQWRGEEADHRVDIFSFSVALYEALYAVHPFTQASPMALMQAVLKGEVREPSARRGVPAAIERALRRGLAPDPEARWRRMEPLLDALTAAAPTRRRGALAAAGLALSLGLAGLYAGSRGERDPCAGAAAELDGAWDEGRREALRAAFVAARPEGGAEAAAVAESRLDAYAERWIAAREGTCVAFRDARRSERSFDLQSECLDARREELASLTDALVGADPAIVEGSIEASAGLRSVEACADARGLADRIGEPQPELADEVRRIRSALAEVRTLIETGQYADAEAASEAALLAAEAIAYPPLRVEALVLRGRALRARDRDAEADERLEEAIVSAEASRYDELALEALSERIFLLAEELASADRALALVPLATAKLRRLGEDRGLRAGTLAINAAVAHIHAGELDTAEADLERALTILESAGGREHPHYVRALLSLGNTHYMRGDLDAAEGRYREALALSEAVYYPTHPRVALVLSNLAAIHLSRDEAAAARPLFERALAIEVASAGPRSERAAVAMNGLAGVLLVEEDDDGAYRMYSEAAAIFVETVGPTHPKTAHVLVNLGFRDVQRGDHDVAIQRFERALAGFEAAHGDEHPYVAYPLVGLAQAHLERGEAERALAYAERGLRIREDKGAEPLELAKSRWILAQALTGADRELARAEELARAAAAAYREGGAEDTTATIERWIAERPVPTRKRPPAPSR